MTGLALCRFCGLDDPRVDAGGLFYCPSTTCAGPGGGLQQHVGLRDLALFGERLLEAGKTVSEETRTWARAMAQKFDALLVEVVSARAAIPDEVTRAMQALRALSYQPPASCAPPGTAAQLIAEDRGD